MLKLCASMILCGFFSLSSIYAQLTIPSLSPSAEVKQTIGLSSIEIKYSRPSARERLIFGDEGLVRNGEFWRTGANAATQITIKGDLSLNGKTLPAASYAILSKPNQDYWDIYFYPFTSTNWNVYVDQQPILKIKAKAKHKQSHQESFQISFDHLEMGSASMILAWADTRVTIDLAAEFKNAVMQDIDRTLAGPSKFDYFQAALFLHETDSDLAQALLYIQKANDTDNPLFFQVYREALILQDLGRNKEAKSVANQALTLSQKAENMDFVRLCQKLIEAL